MAWVTGYKSRKLKIYNVKVKRSQYTDAFSKIAEWSQISRLLELKPLFAVRVNVTVERVRSD